MIRASFEEVLLEFSSEDDEVSPVMIVVVLYTSPTLVKDLRLVDYHLWMNNCGTYSS